MGWPGLTSTEDAGNEATTTDHDDKKEDNNQERKVSTVGNVLALHREVSLCY